MKPDSQQPESEQPARCDEPGERRAGELEREVARLRAQLRAVTGEAARTQARLREAKRALADCRAEAERLRQQTILAENQVTKTRATLSFQLGYLLIHGLKSPSALKQVPRQLRALNQEAKRRRTLARVRIDGLSDPLRQAPIAARPSSPSPTARRAPPRLTLALDGTDASFKGLKVACVADEFTYASFAPECDLRQLSADEWERELEQFQPAFLFIESAWRGQSEAWQGKLAHTNQELVGAVQWCHARGIPTAFWNKEDPVHFETFLNTAKLFDYVFTTDIECIPRYKAMLGHDRVRLLPFACQPSLTNPIEKYSRKDAICFAGAYYARYPERARDLRNLIDALGEHRPVEIYDRNHGKHDPNYRFPPEYQPLILGNLPFDQIDRAYKGYRYALNLNSVTQSQTMFARRVFELLASNTLTISNFSRGLRLLFGDLVIAADDGPEAKRRLAELGADDARLRKVCLAGLRKVMMEHTYQDRLAYVLSTLTGSPVTAPLPSVLVAAYAQSQPEVDSVLGSFARQTQANRRMLLVIGEGLSPAVPADERVRVLRADQAGVAMSTLLREGEWLAGFVGADYYGPNYLLDLVLATRYSHAGAIGKSSHWSRSGSGGLDSSRPGREYRGGEPLAMRSALLHPSTLGNVTLLEWLASLPTRELAGTDTLSIDAFNYCRDGGLTGLSAEHAAAVNDLDGLDGGIAAPELLSRAESLGPEQAAPDATPALTGSELGGYFRAPTGKGLTFSLLDAAWAIESDLPDGTHHYVYARRDLRPEDLGFGRHARFHLDVTPGLNVQLVMLFLDERKQRIGHVVKGSNRNEEAPIPAATHWLRLGVRIYGPGAARINALLLGHRPPRPPRVIARSRLLVLTNHYPAYGDLYRNGFVHTRVKGYAKRGVRADVFRLRDIEVASYREFQNVDVITGSEETLDKLLASGQHQSVLVHFLNEGMWRVLERHLPRARVCIWIHGAEIHPWQRRSFNYESDDQQRAAQAQSQNRTALWQRVLSSAHDNLQFVFVSASMAREVAEDYGVDLQLLPHHIIHNPIDTELFGYLPKPVEQRTRVLSIRPFASRQYANDLSVRAICELANKPYFDELEFRIIGDGPLFERTVEPIAALANVHLERRFLTQDEIAELHRDYGVFLCPSRWDSQGVSRDEAMSSGLVPVTTAVAAIPEFVDARSGVLCPPEDASALARGIAMLYEEPDTFLSLSRAAAARVRSERASHDVIERELGVAGMTTAARAEPGPT